VSDILLNGKLEGVCSPELVEAIGLCVNQYEKRIAELEAALREIAENTHLGNSWARHKAKEALEVTK
jgi:hypothetical protein